jgi:oxygen-independent coproporphyrinogen-3 oxidase
MQELRACFAFAPDAEIAFEIDPRELPAETTDVLQEIGITRASIGVQDFDPQVQRTINRMQSFELTARCADRLRASGVRSINLDLIYGLPHQTAGGVISTVTQALRIRPDRVAVFGYAHVPWMKRHQRLLPEEALPGRSQRYAQREAAEAAITMHGYQPIGMDHFALPDDRLALAAASRRLHRNFQGYTTDDAPVLLGFGASAIGRLPQGYVQNEPRIPLWRHALRTETLPVVRGVALTAADRLRGEVIEQIMCSFEADLEHITTRHHAPLASLMDAAPALQEMARDGIIDWDGTRLRVTNAGRPFVRSIAAAFDAYWQPGAARHSTAV